MWTLCRALLCGAAVEFGPQGCAGGQGPGSVGPEPMIRAEPQRLGIGITPSCQRHVLGWTRVLAATRHPAVEGAAEAPAGTFGREDRSASAITGLLS